MTIAVKGSEQFFKVLNNDQKNVQWILMEPDHILEKHVKPDALFYEEVPGNLEACTKFNVPVFVSAVSHPLSTYKNIIRFNGWPGFLENDTWEICGEVNEKVESILQALGKKFILCTDEPGFISARIIAMIINEAFLAQAENISTAEEIDVAMKLGTNYPYGPFEWADKIGISKIHSLLKKLAETNTRYQPAASLIENLRK